MILPETAIVQPDLVYLHRTRQGAISPRGVEGPPTLVVEILSPSTNSLALRATGAEPVSPPPFENLALVPDALWP